jgi:hypothetical protein
MKQSLKPNDFAAFPPAAGNAPSPVGEGWGVGVLHGTILTKALTPNPSPAGERGANSLPSVLIWAWKYPIYENRQERID